MIGTAGQWEVFLGTGMPEQQKYELSTYGELDSVVGTAFGMDNYTCMCV